MKTEGKHNKVKFEERLKNEINHLLRGSLKDPRLTFVSVTHVELNKDYSCAKVFWDTFQVEQRDQIEKAFSGVTGKTRSLLAKNLQVRHTPIIEFVYNSQFEDEARISQLIQNTMNGQEE